LEENMVARKYFLFLPLLAALLVFFGCNKSTVEPEIVIEEPNMSDEFGGYADLNEEPGFADEALLTLASESELEYSDPYYSDTISDTIPGNLGASHYHLRILWGRLRYDSTSTTPTDWSGSLTVTRGVEVLRRVIRFEPSSDYIVTRKNRRLIEWVSQTTVHHDGIGVDIYVPPAKPQIDSSEIVETDSLGNEIITIVVDTTWPEPDKVEFSTGLYSRTFELDELAALDTVVYLDDSLAVSFQGFDLKRFRCPRGFLYGGWGFDDSGNGVFRGVWMDRTGYVNGFLKGHFGIKDNGARVFYGKWVSREGRFEGFIRGHWGNLDQFVPDSMEAIFPAGYFRGSIYNSNRVEIGSLAGKFHGGPNWAETPRGYFQGRWKLFCAGELRANSEFREGF
jgi:hypothetical protein